MRWLDVEEMAVWWGWLRSASLLEQRLDQELTDEHGIGLADYEVLVQLDHAGGRLRMHELADSVLVSRSRLTHQVDRLVDRGLVCRERCPSDRRGAFAVLTPTGQERLRAAAPTHVRGVRAYLVDQLQADDRRHLTRILDRMRDALGDPRRADPPPDGCGIAEG